VRRGMARLLAKVSSPPADFVVFPCADVASTTKWVSGAMIMRVVASGKLKLSDLCSQYFDYWTQVT
jgi:CubicO group peptidase (beta-lactamase class C family)